MNYFIAVNYNTSCLIEGWASSIRRNCANSKLILIDNYFSDEERAETIKICVALSIDLVTSKNVGYGAALNEGMSVILNNHNGGPGIIFAGNLDLEYLHIQPSLPEGNFIYVPKVEEVAKQNRNPFLTRVQKHFLWTYKFAARYNSVVLYFLAVAINKLLGFIPSKIWAVHGSLFCFNLKSISLECLPFDTRSFLYGEELEFASFMEMQGAEFVDTNVAVRHISHVATKAITKRQKDFLLLWAPSYNNWYRKWQ